MEDFTNENQLYAHYAKLRAMGAFIDRAIDEQVGVVYDELKNYIETLTCCRDVHFSILDREARFEYALANLKSMVWQKHLDNAGVKNNEGMKK